MTAQSLSAPVPGLPAEARRWTRAFLWLIGGCLVFRVVYSAVFPLDLAPDESYYWDWGRTLDYGYYSKPPMIAWLMALAGWIGRDSMFILKFFPSMLAAGGLVFVFLLGRDLFDARTGFWSAAAFMATPAQVALGTFFTIDAPLMLAWSSSLWLAWRWWTAERHAARWSAALAVSLGLGYLTKQIQLAFPLLLIAFAVVERRQLTRKKAAMLGLLVATSLLFLLPPLIWNWRHDWITFRHTADELDRSVWRFGRSVKFVLEFIGGQAGLGGGLMWILMIGAAVAAMRHWSRAGARERFLLVFFLPGLVAYGTLALRQRVEQNWALVFYAAGIVLATRHWTSGTRGGAPCGQSAWWNPAVGLSGILAVALVAVPFVVPPSPLGGRRSDPTARLRGWRDLAAEVGTIRQKVPRPEKTFLLAPRDRYVASALAYYLPDHPRAFCWEEPGRPESQYGIWGRPLQLAGWDALIIEADPPDAARVREVSARFGTWERAGEVFIRLGGPGARDRRYTVFLGRNFSPHGPEVGTAAVGEGYPLEFQATENKRIDTRRQAFRFTRAGSRIATSGASL